MAVAVVAVELFMLSLKVNLKCLAATGIWRPEPKAEPHADDGCGGTAFVLVAGNQLAHALHQCPSAWPELHHVGPYRRAASSGGALAFDVLLPAPHPARRRAAGCRCRALAGASSADSRGLSMMARGSALVSPASASGPGDRQWQTPHRLWR